MLLGKYLFGKHAVRPNIFKKIAVSAWEKNCFCYMDTLWGYIYWICLEKKAKNIDIKQLNTLVANEC